MSDVGVVRILAAQERNSRGTAYRDCGIVIGIGGTLLNKVLLNIWHVREGVHPVILIIRENKQNVGSLLISYAREHLLVGLLLAATHGNQTKCGNDRQ